MHTDYSEYDNAQTANVSNYAKFQHKFGRRRDTYECGVEQTYGQPAVHSTKYNPQKNLELRGLFKEPISNNR